MKENNRQTLIKLVEQEFESEVEYQYSQNEKDFAYLRDLLNAYKDLIKKDAPILQVAMMIEMQNKIKMLKGEQS